MSDKIGMTSEGKKSAVMPLVESKKLQAAPQSTDKITEKAYGNVSIIPDYPRSRKKTGDKKKKLESSKSSSKKKSPLAVDDQQDNTDLYRDYSSVELADFYDDSIMIASDAPFSIKLHRILSNPEFSRIISWLPHGRSWRVLQPKIFEEKVIPRYFRHTRFSSFMRQVNGWGFRRISRGIDINSYYHELFLRGMPHLCLSMRRLGKSQMKNVDPNYVPDFYNLSALSSSQETNNAFSEEDEAQNTSLSDSSLEKHSESEREDGIGFNDPNLASPNRDLNNNLSSTFSALASAPILHQPNRGPTSRISSSLSTNALGRTGILEPSEFTAGLGNYGYGLSDLGAASELYKLQLQQQIIGQRLENIIQQRNSLLLSGLINPPMQQQPTDILREASLQSQLENQVLRANLLGSQAPYHQRSHPSTFPDDQLLRSLYERSLR